MISCQTRQITASDGVRLHFRQWSNGTAPTGVVVCLHGIQSHSGWYDYSPVRMAETGTAVYFADRRGSGLNGRWRGHADHGLRLLNDVRQLVRLVRREHPNVPLTLMGLSWGGKTAAAFAAVYPQLIDRLALLYPGLKPRMTPTLWQRFQLSYARRHDLRRYPVTIPLQNSAWFTDDLQKQDFIENDPLTLEVVTSGLLNAGRDLDLMILRRGNSIEHPLLLMLAGNDQIIDNKKTKQVVDRFPSRRLTCVTYRDACHTLEFDAQRETFVNDLISWLKTI